MFIRDVMAQAWISHAESRQKPVRSKFTAHLTAVYQEREELPALKTRDSMRTKQAPVAYENYYAAVIP